MKFQCGYIACCIKYSQTNKLRGNMKVNTAHYKQHVRQTANYNATQIHKSINNKKTKQIEKIQLKKKKKKHTQNNYD